MAKKKQVIVIHHNTWDHKTTPISCPSDSLDDLIEELDHLIDEDKIKELSKGKVTVVRSQFGESDRAKSMTAAQDMLTANPTMTAIFGPNESSAVGALNAIRSRQQLGKIKIVGFDTPDILVEAVRKGDVDSIVVQNPFKMGYEGVKAIVDKKAGKDVKPRIDTGVKLITTADIDKPESKEWLQG